MSPQKFKKVNLANGYVMNESKQSQLKGSPVQG